MPNPPLFPRARGNFFGSDDHQLPFSSPHRPVLFPSLSGHIPQGRPSPQNPRDPVSSGMADTFCINFGASLSLLFPVTGHVLDDSPDFALMLSKQLMLTIVILVPGGTRPFN